MTVRLSKLVSYLDDFLHCSDFAADAAHNGLQVEGKASVRKVAFAVDACEATIRGALRRKADILIVHHGILWGDREPITGVTAGRLRLLLGGDLSLYAAHLPLDAHAVIGNNAGLAALLGLRGAEPFGAYKGLVIGLKGDLPRAMTPAGLAAKTGRVLGTRAVTLAFGPARIVTVCIVSGGGASLAAQAAAGGCDALVTGETSHSAYHIAAEAGINLVCAGHYATETLGVRGLEAHVRETFGLATAFVDVPTGL